jgi:DNA repair exonuclease SbcCD ATPase subunit
VELGALTEAERLALEAEQEGLVEAMGEYLDGIRTTVTRLTAHVSQPYQGAEFIGTLTRLMDQGESSISELKAAQRTQFDGLLSSENELDKELQLFVERAKGWENSTTASSTAAVAAPVVRRPKTAGGVPGMRPARPLKEVWDGLVPDEVTAYDSFVERTGATGSWDAPDHAYFKKTLARCGHDYARTTEVLATEMAAVFSRGEVIAHARWDAEHEDLLIRKRMAIQRWRAEKEKRQAEQLQAGLQAVAATSAAAAPRKVTAAEASEEREEQRRALEAWRAERKAKADELERARVEQEEAAAEERRRVRAAKLKEQRQRQAAEEAAARQREAAVAEAVAGQNRPRSAPQFRSRPTAAELAKLKAMHERDLLLAARRTAAVGACKQKTSAKARRLEELRVQRKPSAPAAPRDPARLLRPTAAVAARLLAEDGPGQLFAERPVHVPRMVPSWMSN